MNVNDILLITEYGTKLRIFDCTSNTTSIEGTLLSDSYDKFSQFGDKQVLSINTNDDSVNFELVVK